MIHLIRKIVAATVLMTLTMGFTQGYCKDSCAPSKSSCPPIPCAPTICCGNIFLVAEGLCWRAYEGGLSSPCDGIDITNSVEDGIIVSRLSGKSHDPHFEWNFGFRVGGGYDFGECGIDIGAFWTSYDCHSGSEDDHNRHKLKINLDVVDVLFRCECNRQSCIILNPYVGVRYAKINQHHQKHFTSTIDQFEERTRWRLNEHFWGVGPLLGIEADLGIRCGFSFYGNVAVGVLYGDFDTKSHRTTFFDTGTNIDRLETDAHASEVVLDLGLGVRWRTCYCDNKFLFLQLGVEDHRYFNHNQFCDYGDLSFSGVNFGFGIEF